MHKSQPCPGQILTIAPVADILSSNQILGNTVITSYSIHYTKLYDPELGALALAVPALSEMLPE